MTFSIGVVGGGGVLGAVPARAVSVWQDKKDVHDISARLETRPSIPLVDPSPAEVDPELRDAFVSGPAPAHPGGRLPEEFRGAPSAAS